MKHSLDDTEAKQKTLQQKFATERRKQLLKLYATQNSKLSKESDTVPVPAPDQHPYASKAQRKKASRRDKRANRALRRVISKRQKAAARAKNHVVRRVEGSSGTLRLSLKYEESESKAPEFEREVEKSSDTAKQKKLADPQPTKRSNANSLRETSRKAKLAERLEQAHEKKTDGSSKSRKSSTKIPDVAGFDSLQGALRGKASKMQTSIEKADATKLSILRKKYHQISRSC